MRMNIYRLFKMIKIQFQFRFLKSFLRGCPKARVIKTDEIRFKQTESKKCLESTLERVFHSPPPPEGNRADPPVPSLKESPCSWRPQWNQWHSPSTDWPRRLKWWWPIHHWTTLSSSLLPGWMTPAPTPKRPQRKPRSPDTCWLCSSDGALMGNFGKRWNWLIRPRQVRADKNEAGLWSFNGKAVIDG